MTKADRVLIAILVVSIGLTGTAMVSFSQTIAALRAFEFTVDALEWREADSDLIVALKFANHSDQRVYLEQGTISLYAAERFIGTTPHLDLQSRVDGGSPLVVETRIQPGTLAREALTELEPDARVAWQARGVAWSEVGPQGLSLPLSLRWRAELSHAQGGRE